MSFLTNLVPLPYRLLALAVMALALWGWGWVDGAKHEEKKFDAYKVDQEKAVIVQAQKVAQVRSDLLSDAVILEGVKNAENKVIDDKLAAARADIVRLRADRRPADTPTPTACTGSTGKELSRPDAEFLSGIAADADRFQAALRQCQSQYNQARDALEKLAK
jgi:hypothetical protein